MERYFDVVQNRQGTALPGVTVTVYDSNGNLATLYSNPSFTPTTNPIYTNSDGEYAFYAANGTYSINLNLSGFFNETKLGVVLFDPSDAQTANQINFLQAGSGAVTRTVQSKLRDTVSVKDFGAVGDGVADDSAAIQDAVDSLTSGGTLVFPFGTYKINTHIDITVGNITLLGNGSTIDATAMAFGPAVRNSAAVFRFDSPNPTNSTTLASTALKGSKTLTLTSAAAAVVGKFIRCISNQVQYRNGGALAYFNDQNRIVDVSGSTVTLETNLEYDLTVSPHVVTVTTTQPISNITVDGFTMLGGGVRQDPLGNGLGPIGVSGEFVEYMTVKNCKFYGFQGFAVYFDGARDIVVTDCYAQGIDADIPIVEGQNSGFYGFNVARAARVLMTNCTGQRVRHLFDGQEVYQFIQSNSIANNTHRAAFGSHEEVYNISVIGCTSYSCYSGCVLRALTANVTGNTFVGSDVDESPISSGDMLYTDPGRAQFIISSNRFYATTSGSGAIGLSSATELLIISNNTIEGDNPGVSLIGTNASYVNTSITGNIFLYGASPSSAAAINVPTTTGIDGDFKGLLIANNTSRGHANNMISLYGCSDPTNPADYIKITDNVGLSATGGGPGSLVSLRNGGYYGESIVIRGNTQWVDASAAVSICAGEQYRLRAYPVVELNDETNKNLQGNRTIAAGSTSSPTALNNATLFVQSVIESTAPTAGSTNYWLVTTAGTNGSIAGVAGDITAGSNVLTLTGNDNTKVYNGSYINVAGAGVAGAALTRVRVESVNAGFTQVTLSSNASTTVTGAAISRANPVIAAGANLV